MNFIIEDENENEEGREVIVEDIGGGVYPSQICPHIFNSPAGLFAPLGATVEEIKGTLAGPFFACCSECDSSTENWVCLSCKNTGCSRYVKSHGENHFMQSLFADAVHPLALSRSDLSVWCYACSSYVAHERLAPLICASEQIKFPENPIRQRQLSRSFPVGFALQPAGVQEKHVHPENKCLERPVRVAATLTHLENKALLKELVTIPVNPALGSATALLRRVHTQDYIDAVRSGQLAPQPDIYQNEHTSAAAESAVESLASLVSAVCTGQHGLRAGFALLRPPGHHAEAERAGGFCFFNAIAVAAALAREVHGFRVAIVDWDIHQGNGAQQIFYRDPAVLTISIHKHCGVHESLDGGLQEVQYDASGLEDRVGEGPGEGFNVNVPLGCQVNGDEEYLYVFDRVVLPVLAHFQPDLILIAAGMDAGVGDQHLPVGGYALTTQGFAGMTHRLCALCPRVVASIEGGYDIKGLADASEAVVTALLQSSRAYAEGHVAPAAAAATFGKTALEPETVAIVDRVVAHIAKYWPGLK